MKARGISFVAMVAVAGLPGRLVATEFDMLADDSYLSPTVLASVRGKDPKPPMYAWVAATVATESDYLYRNDSAAGANAVGLLTGDYYADNWQFGGGIEHRTKLNRDDPDDGIVPRERYRAYAGYYFPWRRNGANDRFGGSDYRVLGGLSTDRRQDGRWVDEAFIELSIRLLPEQLISRRTFFKDVTGGYLYAWRSRTDEHFVGYSFKATLRDREHGLNVRYMLSFGAERKGSNSHWGEIQNGLGIWYTNARTELTFELDISVSRDVHRREWNDQLTFAIKRDLVTKIIRR